MFLERIFELVFCTAKRVFKSIYSRKAIYKRNPETFSNIVNLAQLAIEDGDKETAKEILTFVLDNTKDIDLMIQSNAFLIKMRIDSAQEQDLKQ